MMLQTQGEVEDDEEAVDDEDAEQASVCETQLPETDVAQLNDVTDATANHRLSGDTPVKKQRSAKKGVSSEPLKNVHEMASSATRLLTQIANKKEKCQEINDKDWDFCRFIYHKIKAIPEGEDKEDMLLDIQQIIGRTRKQYRKTGPITVDLPSSQPVRVSTEPQCQHRQPPLAELQPAQVSADSQYLQQPSMSDMLHQTFNDVHDGFPAQCGFDYPRPSFLSM